MSAAPRWPSSLPLVQQVPSPPVPSLVCRRLSRRGLRCPGSVINAPPRRCRHPGGAFSLPWGASAWSLQGGVGLLELRDGAVDRLLVRRPDFDLHVVEVGAQLADLLGKGGIVLEVDLLQPLVNSVHLLFQRPQLL